jgi:hypothetical protein
MYKFVLCATVVAISISFVRSHSEKVRIDHHAAGVKYENAKSP